MAENKSIAPPSLPPGVGTAVTVGTFDGLHKGHLGILDKLLNEASAQKLSSLVVTFDPHPRQVLQPEFKMKVLLGTQAKVRLLAELGVDYVAVLKFDRTLSQVAPEKFVEDYLVSRYGMKSLVVGYDHAFGKDRAGSEKVLGELATVYGYSLIKVPPVLMDGKPISSSWVRSALDAGDMQLTSRLLGRFFTISGKVVEGAGRGKGLGHPTANIEPEDVGTQAIPEGIYAAAVALDGKLLRGALHYGPRPTFNEKAPTLELNLFDFSGDLYGRRIEVSVIERIRPILRFKSAGDLTRQMDRDDQEVKKVFEKISMPASTLSRAV